MKDYLIEESQAGLPQELITKVEYMDAKAPIQQGLSMLKKYPAVLVKKNGSYYGIMDSRSLSSTPIILPFRTYGSAFALDV